MIRTGRLSEFISHLIKTYNKEVKAKNAEQEDRIKWEFWLHRCPHLTYAEFLKQTSGESQATAPERPSDDELLEMIQRNKAILDGFSPV